MKKLLRRLWDFMHSPGLRRPLMIAAPLLALILLGLVLLPRLRTEPAPAPGPAVLRTDAVEPLRETAEAEAAVPETPRETEAPLPEKAEEPFGWKTVDGREYYVYEDGSFAVGLQKIGGKFYYFDLNGVKAGAVGIDVSFYNSEINWDLVKAQGIDFAIIRVGGRGWTGGLIYDDCRTHEFLRGAREAGIRIGVYFYSTAVNQEESMEEARYCLKAVGGIPLDFPIFIDMEFSGEYPHGRSDRLSPSQRAEIVTAFCEIVRNAGYEPGVYAGQNFLKACVDYFSVSRYTVWLASYTVDNKLPFFSKRYDIWQFSESGVVSGIEGDVDMNVIF